MFDTVWPYTTVSDSDIRSLILEKSEGDGFKTMIKD